MKKADIKVLIILGVIFCFLVLIYTGTNNVYGSMTDWVMQHTVFPDYFRSLFYSTGDITPNLALNMGAGQNAYYFSYYGLLNPFVLLSYFFPYIKIIDYLIIINILIVIASAFLVYKWLTNNKYNSKIALLSSILFLLINAFFHAHRHIMFIDYMPFLILGLIGVDKYFYNKKSYLYIISVFFMIMCSYYYSVGGLLCLVIYGIYKYLKLNEKITIKLFLIDGFKFLIPMFVGIIMSFILLIPTAFAILSSRSQIKDTINLGTIIMPNFNFDALLYSNYGMGFTAIALIALVYSIIHSKGAKRFLSSSLFIMLVMPLFMYILNGMLYLRGKVFIPMSPLIVLVIAMFLTDLKRRKVTIKDYIIVLLVIVSMALVFNYHDLTFYLDLIITTLGIIAFIWKRRPSAIYIPLIAIALCSNIVINGNDEYVTEYTYNKLKSSTIDTLVQDINNDDQTFYRMSNILNDTSLTVNKVYNTGYYQTSVYSSTYNPNYKTFHDDIVNNAIPYRNNLMTASSNNIIFQTLMGIKYVITNGNNVPIGYNLVAGDNELGIYKNNDVLPLGYSSPSLMGYDQFNKLDYPYRSEALLNNIIVDKETISDYTSNIIKTDLLYDYESNVNVEKINQKYIIDTAKEETISLNLKESVTDKVLFISFKLDSAPNCKEGDISITINGVPNKLTCKQWLYFNDNYNFEYVISSDDKIDKLDVTVSKGHFEIEDINVFTLDYKYVVDSVSKVDKFIVDTDKTEGNTIEGTIEVSNDGYFATTIPYDKGFTIYTNGRKTKYELVNGAFIGFPISKGTYNIRLVYKSPGYDMGAIGSAIGLIIFVLIIVLENKNNKKINGLNVLK